MDDILVIILTLVVAVVGALGQRKKKRNLPQAESGGAGTETPDFWDTIMGAQEQPMPQPVVQEEVEESEEVAQPVSEPGFQFSVQNEGASDIEEEEKVEVVKRKVKIDGEDFSLRKAVIYNEILNRKYT